jgi:hypothetical protein
MKKSLLTELNFYSVHHHCLQHDLSFIIGIIELFFISFFPARCEDMREITQVPAHHINSVLA